MELQHGCRSEYGPLELRIQITDSLNGFTVYVEDSRQAHQPVVDEHEVQSTLESAQESAVLRADEYLKGRNENCGHKVDWRCS
ncbi:MAG TPA: hypothetical protein VN841_00850 [Bryobacteraceae bacterium]|nr:hypothetical protein [Bryobacteraceae bacterium]